MSDYATTVAHYLGGTLTGVVRSAAVNHGLETIVIVPAKLRAVARILRDELKFGILLDVSAIDWSRWRELRSPRFEVDYFFYSIKDKRRIQIKVAVPLDENPELESIADIFASADWAERECWDMMGIRFKGHPHLARLLTWKEFMGHALRKDYPLNRRQPIPQSEELL